MTDDSKGLLNREVHPPPQSWQSPKTRQCSASETWGQSAHSYNGLFLEWRDLIVKGRQSKEDHYPSCSPFGNLYRDRGNWTLITKVKLLCPHESEQPHWKSKMTCVPKFKTQLDQGGSRAYKQMKGSHLKQAAVYGGKWYTWTHWQETWRQNSQTWRSYHWDWACPHQQSTSPGVDKHHSTPLSLSAMPTCQLESKEKRKIAREGY